MMGFHTIVIDDRWAFANKERFPHAADIRVGPFAEVLESLSINDQTFVVVVTRGHVHDEASVKAALNKTPAYIGMIGSKRRAKTTLERLAEQGYSPEQLSRIHTPMGLDLAAETPAEIAVAIAAEIVRARRRGSIETLSAGSQSAPNWSVQIYRIRPDQICPGIIMISGILLAAGESRRMGSPKALLPYEGQTFIARICHAFLTAGVGELIVVLGAWEEKLRPALPEHPALRTVVNSQYRAWPTVFADQRGLAHSHPRVKPQ